MKRKTVTFNKQMLGILKLVNDTDRLKLYDRLTEHYIYGFKFKVDDLSGDARIALAALELELRKINQKFEAGISKKKATNRDSILYCNSSGSEMKRNEAKRSVFIKKGSKKYIPYKNIRTLYKYKFLLPTTTINIRAHAHASNPGKEPDATNAVSTEKNTATSERATVERLQQIILQIYNGPDEIQICGVSRQKTDIIRAILEYFDTPDALRQISDALKEIDTDSDIKKPYKYTVSRLYNMATGAKKPNSDLNFQSHNYTKEYLDSLYDDINNIEP